MGKSPRQSAVREPAHRLPNGTRPKRSVLPFPARAAAGTTSAALRPARRLAGRLPRREPVRKRERCVSLAFQTQKLDRVAAIDFVLNFLGQLQRVEQREL